jgi:hypothetical protein
MAIRATLNQERLLLSYDTPGNPGVITSEPRRGGPNCQRQSADVPRLRVL